MQTARRSSRGLPRTRLRAPTRWVRSTTLGMRPRRRAQFGVLLLLAISASPLRAQSDSALRSTLETIARTSGGQLGIGIEVLETQRRLLVNDAFHYPMQSVYKLPIA